MPLLEIPLTYLSSRVQLNDLHSNGKLLSDEEIVAVKSHLKKKKRDGRYKKTSFTRMEMPNKFYSIIRFQEKYYAIYKGKEHLLFSSNNNIRIKLVQELDSGEWHRLKISQNKDTARIENEYKFLKQRGFIVAKFSHTTKADIEKHYLLMKSPTGVDLNSFIQYDRQISTLRCLEIAIGILKKIKAVHDQKYLLCQLTLDNILYDSASNLVNLCNFESILQMDENRQARQPICGTDIYIAPEILNENELIELTSCVIADVEQNGRRKLSEADLLLILDNSPILVRFPKEKKAELVTKLQRMEENEFDRLVEKSNAETPEFTYTEQTDSYAAGIILKLLFNIPVKEISYLNNQFTNKYFKIGKEKEFDKNEHRHLIKFLDSMTTQNPEHRPSIAEALAFLQNYYQSCLSYHVIKIGIFDIRDFEIFMKGQGKVVDGFGRKFKNLANQMDEVYIVSKTTNVEHQDIVKIKTTLTRFGIIFNNVILLIPAYNALAEIPAYVEATKKDSLLRSYTYFDFSKYSQASDHYVDETDIKENGISIQVNGHRVNGVVADDRPQTPLSLHAFRHIAQKEINDFLTKNGINVISIDLDKPWNIMFQEMSKCVMTISKNQFDTLKRELEGEINNLDKKLNDPKYTRPARINDTEYLALTSRHSQVEKTLALFNQLQAAHTLSYTITHNALDILRGQRQPQGRISEFFSLKPVESKLLSQIKAPEVPALKISNKSG